MSFLILESRRHEQWKDLIKESACSQFSGVMSDLAKCRLPHGWSSILDFEKQHHDFAFFLFLQGQIFILYFLQQSTEVAQIFWLYVGECVWPCRWSPWDIIRFAHLLWDAVVSTGSASSISRCCCWLFNWLSQRFICFGHLYNFVSSLR